LDSHDKVHLVHREQNPLWQEKTGGLQHFCTPHCEIQLKLHEINSTFLKQLKWHN